MINTKYIYEFMLLKIDFIIVTKMDSNCSLFHTHSLNLSLSSWTSRVGSNNLIHSMQIILSFLKHAGLIVTSTSINIIKKLNHFESTTTFNNLLETMVINFQYSFISRNGSFMILTFFEQFTQHPATTNESRKLLYDYGHLVFKVFGLFGASVLVGAFYQ